MRSAWWRATPTATPAAEDAAQGRGVAPVCTFGVRRPADRQRARDVGLGLGVGNTPCPARSITTQTRVATRATTAHQTATPAGRTSGGSCPHHHARSHRPGRTLRVRHYVLPHEQHPRHRGRPGDPVGAVQRAHDRARPRVPVAAAGMARARAPCSTSGPTWSCSTSACPTSTARACCDAARREPACRSSWPRPGTTTPRSSRLLDAGADDYVVKPFGADQLDGPGPRRAAPRRPGATDREPVRRRRRSGHRPAAPRTATSTGEPSS